MNGRYADLRALGCNILHPMSLPALDREQPLFVTRGEAAPRKLQKSLSLDRKSKLPPVSRGAASIWLRRQP